NFKKSAALFETSVLTAMTGSQVAGRTTLKLAGLWQVLVIM
ncbi:hypothetical protein LCGC14_2381650, partial [marine sediment metagenome]